MSLFLQKDVADLRFPKLSGRIEYLKNNKEGVRAMCDVMEKYMAEEVKIYKEQLAEKEAKIAEITAQKDAQIADLVRQLAEAKKE